MLIVVVMLGYLHRSKLAIRNCKCMHMWLGDGRVFVCVCDFECDERALNNSMQSYVSLESLANLQMHAKRCIGPNGLSCAPHRTADSHSHTRLPALLQQHSQTHPLCVRAKASPKPNRCTTALRAVLRYAFVCAHSL